MRFSIIILFSFLLHPIHSELSNDTNSAKEAFWTAGLAIQNCWKKVNREVSSAGGLVKCLKKKSLVLLNALVDQEELELPLNLRLVKIGHHKNDTVGINKRENSKYEVCQDGFDWASQVLNKLGNVLRTHSLKIPISETTNLVEARRRRRGNNIMPLMLFGVMAMAIISIPLGFQFLAVLGGKSLLLAKLALILTSIQGLKRIATSNLNYGLYHTHRTDYNKPWLYDRRGQPPIPDHHGYQGFDVPDQREDALYHHLSPRISNVLQTN